MENKAELSGHTALIAGATRPVGRAIADKFGRNGASLILPVYTDWPESTEAMQKQFDESGYDYFCCPCDLTSETQVRNLVEQALTKYGVITYLINNIERGGMPIVHGSYDAPVNGGQWDLEFETTVKAKWSLYRHCIESMQASERGSIVNISSMAARVGRSGPASILFNDGYSAANRAVTSFTRQWAREAAPDIRVNEVMLGLCKGRHGEDTRGWSLMSDEQRSGLLDHTLLKRSAAPAELAELVYFIAVKATYMTGSTVLYDGGYLLGADEAADMPPGILGEH